MNRSDPERIFSRIRITERGCWEYLRGRSSKGYGVVSVNNKATSTHCLAYELRVGLIPDGMCVLHQCDNPPCINPAHLFLGTRGENNTDRERKGRSDDRRGELNPGHRLTESQVVEIHNRRVSGDSLQAIADAYGITRNYVTSILSGDAWPHVAERMPRHPNKNTKLTAEQVALIRSIYAAGGRSYSDLAAEFGLTVSGIASIIQRKNWKHVA